VSAGNGRSTVNVHWAAHPGTLTVSFEPVGERTDADVDTPVDQLVLTFDGSEPGALLSVQGLFTEDKSDSWWRFFADCLGPTLAARCRALAASGEPSTHESVVVGADELASLRAWVWVSLHRSCRRSTGRPPLPSPPSSAAVVAPPPSVPIYVVLDDTGATPISATADLPPALAAALGVQKTCTITAVNGFIAIGFTLVGAAPGPIDVTVASPRTEGPAQLEVDGTALTARLARTPPDRAGLPDAVALDVGRKADVPIDDPDGPALETICFYDGEKVYFGRRARRTAGAGSLFAPSDRGGDHIVWQPGGRAQVEIVFVIQGGHLWARGFVRPSDRDRTIELTCRLRPEHVATLRPDERDDPEAAVLHGETTVGPDGFFQVELARSERVAVPGELVEQVELRLHPIS